MIATKKSVTSIVGKAVVSLFVVFGTTSALAETGLVPHALARYERNSNLFLVPEYLPQKDSNGTPRLADDLSVYSGGVDGEYLWRENRFYLTTDFRRYDYQHFSQQDHNEFAGTTGVDWIATHKIKGNLGYNYNRHQVSFVDLNVSATNANNALIETTQSAQLSANYAMNSHWQAEGRTAYSTAKLPDADTQSYDQYQTEGMFGVKYVGAAHLTTGLSITRINGHYRDKPQLGYTLTLYQYSVDYKLGPRSTLNGTFGYTKRAQTGNSLSDTVGSVAFNQKLTEKTSYFLQFRRTLDTYNALQGSQLSTGGLVGFNYEASQKISLQGSYGHDKINVYGSNGVGINRNDELAYANAALKYIPLRWLTIGTYIRYQHRSSDVAFFNFNDKIYGADFEVRFKRQER